MFRATEPKVLAAAEVPGMKWNPPDTEGLVKFLVEEKSFNEDRVRKAAERINASRGKSNQGGVHKSLLGIHSEDCGERCMRRAAERINASRGKSNQGGEWRLRYS